MAVDPSAKSHITRVHRHSPSCQLGLHGLESTFVSCVIFESFDELIAGSH